MNTEPAGVGGYDFISAHRFRKNEVIHSRNADSVVLETHRYTGTEDGENYPGILGGMKLTGFNSNLFLF